MNWKQAIKDLDARYNEMLAEFDKMNAKSITALKGYIYNQLKKIELDEKAVRISKTDKNAEIINRLKSNFMTHLKLKGYLSTYERFVSDYDDIVKFQQDIYSQFGYDEAYGVNDIFAVDVIRKQTLEEVGGLSRLVNAEIRELFDKSFYANGTFKELVNGIEAKLGKLHHWGYTIANTGLQAADAAVSGEIALSLGVDKFFYFGSLDKVTRPFCRALLTGYNPNTMRRHPNIWTRQEISYLKNGQIPDVFLHRGGYNCRHRDRKSVV